MKALILILAGLALTACQFKDDGPSCDELKLEVAALRMCFNDGFCQRTPDYYRDVVRVADSMKKECSAEELQAAFK